MLGLKLRDEFLGEHMPQTAIRLVSSDKTGAAQKEPQEILDITYPTADIQNALRALSMARKGRPIVLMGERGRGKSHIMAVMHHAVAASEIVQTWIQNWGQKLRIQQVEELVLQKGFCAISEPVHNHEYPLLWNLIFDRHPEGQRFKGRFEASGNPIPSRKLLEEMFEAKPTALILDEFQTWFDSLHDEDGPTGKKWRHSAFLFIQVLSELAKDRPDILIFVISVLNNRSEAFQQVHRDTPIIIDFKGPTATEDRQKLLLHRLFKNRELISTGEIQGICSGYSSERFRLKFAHQSDAERDTRNSEVVYAWPFSPELLELIEGHILMAQAAQETRDLIRILAQVFRARGEASPIITPADFFIDDDSCGVQTLLDSIATMGEQEKLREVAQKNLQNIVSLDAETPHTREILSSLWMRSMSPGRNRGGTKNDIHLDITRDTPVDDNAFTAELDKVISNSVNIHGEETADSRLHFELSENPRSKVRSTARNDKLWQRNADSQIIGQTCYPGEDIRHIRKIIKDMFMPEIRQHTTKIIVLGPNWESNPWGDVEEDYRPPRWTEQVLVVIPHVIKPEEIPSVLGKWLATHVQNRRNTIRFLLLKNDTKSLFLDEELLFCSRCSYLVTVPWKDDPEYRSLRSQFERPLRDELKNRFDRFAILDVWKYTNPETCRFHVERIDKEGSEIPPRIEEKILRDLFDPSEFESFIVTRARESYVMNDILSELMDPGADTEALPYLGETDITERVFKIAAKGLIALNIEGTWYGRLPEHQSDEDAYRFISRKYCAGPEMRKIQLSMPNVLGTSTVKPAQKPVETEAPKAETIKIEPINGTINTTADGPTDTVIPGAAFNSQQGFSSVHEKPARVRKSEEPAIAVNLTGAFEKWGIDSDVTLKTAKIEFTDLSVNQVKQILMRIPSSIKASLEISYNDEE